MGRMNTITKDYMSVPERFADCFNYYLFNGEQVIKASNLEPRDPTSITIIPADTKEETVEKIRDLLKQCIVMQDDKATYLLLGIENQSDIHYALPVKNMNYDALAYSGQVSDIAKKHRKMFEDVDEGILKYVEDYKTHLIIPKEIKDLKKFATDFGKVMKYIAV